MEKRKLVLLEGGFSEEREVSLTTSNSIADTLSSSGWDVHRKDPGNYSAPTVFESMSLVMAEIRSIAPEIVFIGLHGGDGENGRFQAMFDLAGIPYTGSGFFASALCMNKHQSSMVAQSLGVPVPAYRMYRRGETCDPELMVSEFGLPLVIKPNCSGSSVGVTIVGHVDEITSAVDEALKWDSEILIQRFIPGKELTVAVLNNQPLPVVEIRPKGGWYDYKHKYTAGETEYLAPAPITEEEVAVLQDMAVTLFRELHCSGYGRVDFRQMGDEFYFLEVNTLPGMTALSLTPKAAAAAGITFPQLLETIIELGLRDSRERMGR